MRTKIAAVMLVPFALLGAGCGRLNDAGGSGGGSEPEPIVHPTGSDELILRVAYEGGFVPVEYTLRQLPSLSLYGDGRIITEGPQIEIYPSPAVPNLLVRTVNEDGIQAILRAARDAGLMAGEAEARYDYPCVTDAPWTVFTVTAEGRTKVVSAYALGLDQGACMDADVEARAALAQFQTKLGSLDEWLPEGSVGAEQPYAATAVRLFVQPYTGSPDPALNQEPSDWPLAGSLARLGDPVPDIEGVRCVALEGEDAAAFLEVAAQANQLTPWRSDGERFTIVIRPLLPDESGC